MGNERLVVVEAMADAGLRVRALARDASRLGARAERNRELAELAFDVLGAPPKVRRLPAGILSFASAAARPFNQSASSLLRARAAFGEMDFVGQAVGARHLRDFFEELRADEGRV